MPEQELKKRKITKKELERKIKGSYCCIVGRSEYINEINKRLLAGADYLRVYSWLRKIGARIGKETIKKHSQHYLDPSINPLAKSNRDGTTTIKKTPKKSKKKTKKQATHIKTAMKINKEKTPMERVSHFMKLAEDRFENISQAEEETGQLTARGDKLLFECFKMAKEYASLVSERQSDEDYWSAELILALTNVIKKMPILQNLKYREEIAQQLKDILLGDIIEEESLAVVVKRNVSDKPV